MESLFDGGVSGAVDAVMIRVRFVDDIHRWPEQARVHAWLNGQAVLNSATQPCRTLFYSQAWLDAGSRQPCCTDHALEVCQVQMWVCRYVDCVGWPGVAAVAANSVGATTNGARTALSHAKLRSLQAWAWA